MIKSKALEVNIADYHVDVTIDPKYTTLQEVMSRYYGLRDSLNSFLLELSHPYRNWQFIVKDARNFALNYFHLLKAHSKGQEAARLFVDIFTWVFESANSFELRTDAADNLLLFLQKIANESSSDIDKFLPVIHHAFSKLLEYPDDDFFIFIRSYYQIKKIIQMILKQLPERTTGFRKFNLFLIRYFQQNYAYWLSIADPQKRLEEEAGEIGDKQIFAHIFKEISFAQISSWNTKLYLITQVGHMESENLLHRLLDLPGYNEIVAIYRQIPTRLFEAGGEKGRGNQWKMLFLFQIMSLSGLSSIHEEALRDINRTLSWLIDHEKYWNIDALIQKTFSILRDQTNKFPGSALNCVVNMGKAIYHTHDSELIQLFLDSLVDLGFQTPRIKGVGNDWQVDVNSAHIQNIRAWLQLIMFNPKLSTRLLSCLIIHLSLFGIFIKDIELFPRDITLLLNSDIEPVYNLVKQLTRLFPAYFNDIGAEGKLRDVSTEIDELSHRKDILIHFLRKQSHVESSNQIIPFMEAVFHFWKTREKQIVKPFVPSSIYDQIETSGKYIDGVHNVVIWLKHVGINMPDDLLVVPEGKIETLLEGAPGMTETDIRRISLAISLYRLLYQKYSLDFVEINDYLSHLSTEAFPGLGRLKEALAETDTKKQLYMLLRYLNVLKKVILSDNVYEAREDIYKKRHITIDIPSMYGSYHETKFDALGLTFRIESLVNALFDDLIQTTDLSLITKATFYRIFAVIRLFDEALKLDGISSLEIERQLDILANSLDIKGFTFTQYLDIFKGFAQSIKNIINDYFHNIHEQNMNRILSIMSPDELLPKYLPKDEAMKMDKLRHRISEIFFRDRISLSLGLQQLDMFVTRILNTLFQQAVKLSKDNLHQLLLYDPDNAMISIQKADSTTSDIIRLGNKGFNMLMLKKYGLPVPPGFIITTEVFRCREVIASYSPAEKNFKRQVARQLSEIEHITGKEFGNPHNPLLLSVRSGSPISQPGMMDTLLDVGINEDIVNGISARTGNTWFAWDSYRRFMQCYGMSFGLERDDFDAIIREFKENLGIPLKSKFSGEQMKAVALGYKRCLLEAGIKIEEDPFEQLYQCIKNVFASWESPKARAYRKIMEISDDWGTAVTIQMMVYGNISHQSSGTGVIFTHSPRWSGDSLRLWGDFTIGNQGEDVVAGLVKTMPISIIQQDTEMRNTDTTLESHFPEIFHALKEWASALIYKKGWSPQEMEFTFESPSVQDLYLLQTRDMAMRERKDVQRFDLAQLAAARYLSHGIGVSGGALSGRAVFSLEEIKEWREGEPNTKLILIRGDTVPDDIREINASDGLLTARGGLTSHASVVAHRLGKTCVVGCGDLICNEKEKFSTISLELVKSGDFISIDGQEGSVFKGFIQVQNTIIS